jgi:hypothetical protein
MAKKYNKDIFYMCSSNSRTRVWWTGRVFHSPMIERIGHTDLKLFFYFKRLTVESVIIFLNHYSTK